MVVQQVLVLYNVANEIRQYREFMVYLRIPDIVKRELELPLEVVWPGEGGVHQPEGQHGVPRPY
jgi:hypothetical protein